MGHPLRSTAAVAAAVVMTGTGITATSAQTAAQTTAEPTQPADAASSLVFNEIESTGDTTDWAELYNTGKEPIDLSGFHFRDDDDDHDYVLPEGSVIEPGGFFVIDQPLDGEAGFDFGLGDPDAARLFAADGSTLLASTSWQEHAEVTYARCPDGTGELRQTTSSTKGEANDCSLPLAINEVSAGEESFVEILNIGSWEADLDGPADQHRGRRDGRLPGPLRHAGRRRARRRRGPGTRLRRGGRAAPGRVDGAGRR